MTFLLTSGSLNIRFRTVLHAVAMVSSDFPISRGPEERRLVSSGKICFAKKKTSNPNLVFCGLKLNASATVLSPKSRRQTIPTAIVKIKCFFSPMDVCTLLVRDMLPSRDMAVFCSFWLGDFNRGVACSAPPNFWTRIWLMALDPWATHNTEGGNTSANTLLLPS